MRKVRNTLTSDVPRAVLGRAPTPRRTLILSKSMPICSPLDIDDIYLGRCICGYGQSYAYYRIDRALY